MPRDGSFIYSIPPGTQGAPDTTIESAKYNAYIADVETDLNAPRPVIAGGTGGNSAAQARDNLDAERSMQVITNFDANPLEVGSFYAASTATGGPVAGHAFAGIIYGPDANNMVIEARDLNDVAVPGIVYIREKLAGVWSPAWTIDSSDKVAKAGDTMTGNLTIRKSQPAIALDRSDAAATAIQGLRNSIVRWQVVPGDATPETGSNIGSNFLITRADDAGTQIDTPISINRATGIVAGNGLVNYALAQTLTAAQQLQARVNLFAAPFDAMAFNNMALNAGMLVSQELGGTAVPVVGVKYIVDGWQAYAAAPGVFQAYQGVSALPGLPMCLVFQATTGAAVPANDAYQFSHPVEGYRIAGLAFGTANAQPVSIGFWMYVPIPGTAGVSISNDISTRSCFQEVTFTSAGWAYKSVTIPGDVAGAWNVTSGTGIKLRICLGANGNLLGTPGTWSTPLKIASAAQTNFFATNGNLVCLTGVTIFAGTEVPNSERLPFIMRPRSYEIGECERYLWGTFNVSNYHVGIGYLQNGNPFGVSVNHPRRMRAVPSCAVSGNFGFNQNGTPSALSAITAFNISDLSMVVNSTVAGSYSPGSAGRMDALDTTAIMKVSAQLS